MINYELKSRVLKSGLCEIEKKTAKTIFVSHKKMLYKSTISSEADSIRDFYEKNNPIEWREAIKINHAHYERVGRLKKRIGNSFKFCLKNNDFFIIWLTLTFNNYSLNKTSSLTRRKYVASYLSSFPSFDYIANIDFGKKNGREHYHALICVNQNIDYKLWTYGSIKGRVVNLGNTDNLRLSKYISKLSNHALKDTTKRASLIFKRKKDF